MRIFKAFLIATIIGFLAMRPAASYADWHDHGGGHSHDGGHGHDGGHYNGGYRGHSYVGVGFSVWPDSYYYGAPYYYPPDDDVLVSAPVTVVQEEPVAVVQSPQVVQQQDQPAPVITTAGTPSEAPDAITVNIPNNKGGYTAVTLKKSGNGYIGPQGEFYTEFPRVSQLEIIYGK